MIVEDKGGQQKEIYAHAGLALYWAQCLEKSLENILVINSRLSGECITLADLEAFENDVENQTLGRLLRNARKHIRFDGDSEKSLSLALKNRNFLAHRFFKKHAEDFFSEMGRDRMIAELIEIRECFQNADQISSLLCKALQKALGITDEMIEQQMEKMSQLGAEGAK